MNATQIQIEQANDKSFIAQLPSAACVILADTNGEDDKALTNVRGFAILSLYKHNRNKQNVFPPRHHSLQCFDK